MKLYADYLKERENIECKYTDNCFITYKKIDDDSLFIFDTYSSPEVRGSGNILELFEVLVDKVKDDCKYIFATTHTDTNGWERSDKLLQKFGFKFTGTDPENKHKRNYGMILGEYNGK